MIKNFLLLGVTLFIAFSASTQVYSNKPVGKNKIETDTISKYKYLLPIWGEKVHAKGFDLPYSAGLGVNYLWQESGLIINELNVGFNNNEPYDLDDIIQFNDATARSQGVNFRPDIWVLPFLNVYGILATSKTSTDVNFGVYVPTGDDFTEVFNASTKAEFKGTTFGVGITPTIGVAGGFLAIDMNYTWTDIAELDKASQIFVIGPRIGKSFNFKTPERAVSIWAGGFRVGMKSETSGNLAISSLFDTSELGGNIDNGYVKLDESQAKLDSWWNSLTPRQQERRQGAYDKGNEAIQKASALLSEMDQAVTRVGESTVQYSLKKRQEHTWNLVLGSQFQFNKHWMIRAEAGFLGSRTQVIAGLQYRFGL